jgi:nuclear pore complex protein Nup85
MPLIGYRLQVVGVHHWKHGHKGAGIAWLQQAHDDSRLSAIADELLASVSLGITGTQTEYIKVKITLLVLVLHVTIMYEGLVYL